MRSRPAALHFRNNIPWQILRFSFFAAAVLAFAFRPARAQTQPKHTGKRAHVHARSAAPNLKTTPTLYLVGYAHLDTQWRWTARDSARDHLPATVAENEVRFDDHPSYVLSFEGAWRYRLLAEHHPERFARVRRRRPDCGW